MCADELPVLALRFIVNSVVHESNGNNETVFAVLVLTKPLDELNVCFSIWKLENRVILTLFLTSAKWVFFGFYTKSRKLNLQIEANSLHTDGHDGNSTVKHGIILG
jgi:hypothetical protein